MKYYSKEYCHLEALKYKTKGEFQKNSSYIYQKAYKNDWLNEICSHMIEIKKINGYWTFEKCKNEAIKYILRSEFKKNSSSAYNAARKNSWLNEICSHMIEIHKPIGYWTFEKCKEECLKYNKIIDLINNSPSCYKRIKNKNWLEQLTSQYIKSNRKSNNYWTFEKCKEEALKYKTKKEFEKKSKSAYCIAIKNNWLYVICQHMIIKKRINGYWNNYDNCKKAALNCNSREDFKKKYGTAYRWAHKNGWLEDMYTHMKPIGDLYSRLIYAYEFSDKSVYVGLTCNSDRRKNEHLNLLSKKSKSTTVTKYILKTGLQPIYKELTEYVNVEEAQKLESFYINFYKKNGWIILNKIIAGGIGRFKLKNDFIK